MSLTIPPATNYPSPIRAVPSNSQDQPREGRRQIACDVTWRTMGGSSKCVAFNVQYMASLPFSQISTLKIDNSKCGADVQFVFSDTMETIDIPAYTPLIVVPVFSNSLSFYVVCPNALPEDETRFIILNYKVLMPSQVNVSTTYAFVGTAVANWNTNPSTVNIIPAGINGTVIELIVGAAAAGAATPSPMLASFSLQDGAGDVYIPSWKLGIAPNSLGGFVNNQPFRIKNMNVRFRNGFSASFTPQASWLVSAQMNLLATYRKTT